MRNNMLVCGQTQFAVKLRTQFDRGLLNVLGAGFCEFDVDALWHIQGRVNFFTFHCWKKLKDHSTAGNQCQRH